MNPSMNAQMWDARYGGAEFAYGCEPNRFLAAQALRLAPGGSAFVPGDGEGRNGVWLATRGLLVDTLDLSAKGVAKAQALAAERGVAINAVQGDALASDWPEARYDLIALIYLHLVPEDRRRLHAKALRALKPGGWIVLESFRPEQIERQNAGARGGPRDPALLYSVQDIRADFAAAKTLEVEAAEIELEEGSLHVGPSSVVRALARR